MAVIVEELEVTEDVAELVLREVTLENNEEGTNILEKALKRLVSS